MMSNHYSIKIPTAQARHGFTLIELSVVLIVIALITGMGMVATLGTIESARRAQTENKLNAIEKALMDFRNQYNRLPCPGEITLTDSSSVYGLEAANPGDCMGGSPAAADVSGNDGSPYIEGDPPAASGGVPTRTLNLPDEFMFDGWNRRFVYVVDSHATAPNAFNIIPPDANNCSIWVHDAANGQRSGDGTGTRGGAIYALLSHGANGHGAYNHGGTQVSAGSTNQNELYNCRCDGTGQTQSGFGTPYFIQQEATEDPDDSTNGFDDIVRFKERWQLQNEEDYRKAGQYPEYQLVVGIPYLIPGSPSMPPNVGFYKRGCDGWVLSRNQSDLVGAVGEPGEPDATVDVLGMVFTPDNNYILAYHFQPSGTEFCTVYDLTPEIPYATALASCGDYNENNTLAMSNNGYLAISNSAGLAMFRQSGGQFNQLYPIYESGTPTVLQPKIIALGRNADYMMLTDKSTYATFYGKASDSTFKRISSDLQPVTSAYDKLEAIAFSPDNKFLAIAHHPGIVEVKLWQIGPGNLYQDPCSGSCVDPLTPLPSLPLSSHVSAMAFSPDGQYLAVGFDEGGCLAPECHVAVYKIDGTDFSPITVSGVYIGADPTGGDAPHTLAFTPDSNTLMMASDECCVFFFDRTSATTFTQRVPPIYPGAYFDIYEGPSSMAVYH